MTGAERGRSPALCGAGFFHARNVAILAIFAKAIPAKDT